MADSQRKTANGWVHSLRKLGTATDTLTTLPADAYADGTNATVGLVGNMQQTGTPTPQNPITPQETGDLTENLLYASSTGTTTVPLVISYTNNSAVFTLNKESTSANVSAAVLCNITLDAGTYSIKVQGLNSAGTNLDRIYLVDSNNNIVVSNVINNTAVQFTLAETTTIAKVSFVAAAASTYNNQLVKIMLNSDSTPLPYQPYGYKLDIKSANTTTPVYLGEVESTRQIKKLVLTGNENFSTSTAYEKENTMVYYTQIADSYNGDNDVIYITSSHYQGVSRNTLYDSDSEMVGMTGSTALTFRVSKTYASNKNLFLSYLAQQYANGTPVCVWYVLATEETGIVNEPLRKIGDYADTVSDITIPTITGADTFDVLTTLKPSEVSLSYTGWHDASVKEWDGSDWQ